MNTGCNHYKSSLDIVSIRFKCCNKYFACYSCHKEKADHPAQKWKFEEFHTKAILCGLCGFECSISEYLLGNFFCLSCKAPFNPNCKKHWNLYFSISDFLVNSPNKENKDS